MHCTFYGDVFNTLLCFVVKYEKAKARVEKVEEERQERRVKHEQINAFLETLNLNDAVLTEFDEVLWFTVIDKVTVYNDDEIEFAFKDGSVLKHDQQKMPVGG